MSVLQRPFGIEFGVVRGDMDVADNEHCGPLPPVVPGFVVGHHPGHVTVDVRRRLHEDLTLADAYQLAQLLMKHVDLARLGSTA